MIIKIEDLKNEVNTSDSYNKEIYSYKNNLIIPYINLEIFEIDINSSYFKKFDKLDFSYLIFKGVVEVSWNEIRYGSNQNQKLTFNSKNNKDHYSESYINVMNINEANHGNELKIVYFDQYLCFSDNVQKISNPSRNYWRPIGKHESIENISDVYFDDFFCKLNVPNEILNLVGSTDANDLKIFL